MNIGINKTIYPLTNLSKYATITVTWDEKSFSCTMLIFLVEAVYLNRKDKLLVSPFSIFATSGLTLLKYLLLAG